MRLFINLYEINVEKNRKNIGFQKSCRKNQAFFAVEITKNCCEILEGQVYKTMKMILVYPDLRGHLCLSFMGDQDFSLLSCFLFQC